MKETEKLTVPIWEKIFLIKEGATVYSDIGLNRLGELLKIPNCSFTLYIGKKKFVKRKKFEKYLAENVQI